MPLYSSCLKWGFSAHLKVRKQLPHSLPLPPASPDTAKVCFSVETTANSHSTNTASGLLAALSLPPREPLGHNLNNFHHTRELAGDWSFPKWTIGLLGCTHSFNRYLETPLMSRQCASWLHGLRTDPVRKQRTVY